MPLQGSLERLREDLRAYEADYRAGIGKSVQRSLIKVLLVKPDLACIVRDIGALVSSVLRIDVSRRYLGEVALDNPQQLDCIE